MKTDKWLQKNLSRKLYFASGEDELDRELENNCFVLEILHRATGMEVTEK